MKKVSLLQQHPERYEAYKKLINSYAWQKLRARKIASQPLCEDCLKIGRTRVAEEVHHATPVEHGTTLAEMRKLAYSFDNLVSLCRECHYLRHHPQARDNEQKTSFTEHFFSPRRATGTDF